MSARTGGPLELSGDGSTFQCQWRGACFDARTQQGQVCLSTPTSHLVHLPIKIDDGQVTYVYGEADQPVDTEVTNWLEIRARPARRRALRLTARALSGWESRSLK